LLAAEELHRRADVETENLLGAAGAVDRRAARGAAGLDDLRSREDGGAAGEAVVELGAAGDVRTEIGAAGTYGLPFSAMSCTPPLLIVVLMAVPPPSSPISWWPRSIVVLIAVPPEKMS
jgi:hypothetical protein